MNKIPSIHEVKATVMGLNRHNDGETDGMIVLSTRIDGILWRRWVPNGIGFFCGFELPRFITYTNLVNTFCDMRLIYLSNFVSKISSRLIHDRLKRLLPEIISEE